MEAALPDHVCISARRTSVHGDSVAVDALCLCGFPCDHQGVQQTLWQRRSASVQTPSRYREPSPYVLLRSWLTHTYLAQVKP